MHSVAAAAIVVVVLAVGCVGRTSVDDPGSPDIAVAADGCDFGATAFESLAQCTVTVSNRGDARLLVDVAVLGDPAFDVIGRIADDAVAPGADIALAVHFAPVEARAYAATLRFTSNDPDSPEVDVPLTGTAAAPPECRARIASVNGEAVAASDAAPQVRPLDDVVLTLADSTSAVGAVTGFRWSVRQAPGEAALGTPDDVTTSVAVDFAGSYLVCGAVVDDEGLASDNDCCVGFDAVASPALSAQVSGDGVVLHVVNADDNGTYCVAGVADIPGDALGTACDNGLDAHAALESVVAVDGAALLALSADPLAGPTPATVHLFTKGSLAGSYSVTVDGYAEVALVDEAACVEDLSDADLQCP